MAKSILITGASGGIGSEIAIQASQKGYKVGLLDLNKEVLEEVESKIPNSVALPTDITDEETRVMTHALRRVAPGCWRECGPALAAAYAT